MKYAKIAAFIVIGILVILGAYSGGNKLWDSVKKPPAVPAAIQQQYNQLNADFQYAGKRENELIEGLINAKPEDATAIAVAQAEIKKYRAERQKIQDKFNKLIAGLNAKKKG